MPEPIHDSSWVDVIKDMQCPNCQADLDCRATAHLSCVRCATALPIRAGICVVKEDYTGNNGIAAEFYDSARWSKYRFWKRFTPFNDAAVTRWSEEVFALVPDLSGARLLDIAIGDGRNMPFVPLDCDLFGVDISTAQLKACWKSHSNRKLWLLQGEAETLPFKSQSFDHVISFGAFNYFNDPLAALREMARVVKPTGMVVVTDEYADLPNRMIGHRIGLPILDRVIMRRFLHLGEDFTRMIETHHDLQIQPIIDQVLADYQISEVCDGWAYCFAGRAKVDAQRVGHAA